MKKQNKRNQFTRMALALLLILSMLGNTLIFPTVAQETVAPVDDTTSSETPSADEATTDAISTPTLPEPILLTAADIPEFISAAALTERGAVERMRSEETNMSSVIFRNSDGTRTMYMYGLPVKYTAADGTVRDKSTNLVSVSTASVLLYDQPVAQTMAQMSLVQQEALQAELGILDVERAATTLHMLSTALTARQRSLSDMAYTTLDNDVYALFPTNLAKGMTLVFGEHSVRMTPAGTGLTVTAGGNVTKTTTSSLSDADVTERLLYPNVFGLGTAVQYTPTLTGVKEEILLSRNVGQNSFAFLLETGGLVLTEINGQFVLIDPETEQQVGKLGEIIVFDSAGRIVRGNMTAQTILAGQKYGITISVDQEFLASATYPVSIDPTATITPFPIVYGLIEDVAIYDDYDAALYVDEDVHQVGYINDDISFRGAVLYRFPAIYSEETYSSFPFGIFSEQLLAFNLHVPVTANNSSNIALRSYQYTTSWINSSMICNNFYYLNYSTTYASEGYLASATGTVSIDLINIARAWLNYLNDEHEGTQANHAYGIMLQANANDVCYSIPSVESGADVYITLDYSDTADIGTFYLNNMYTRNFLGVDSDGDPTTMSGLVNDIGDQIAWNFEYLGNDEYAIHPNGVSTLYLSYSDVIEEFTSSNLPDRLRWKKEKFGTMFIFVSMYDEKSVLNINYSGELFTVPRERFSAEHYLWRLVAENEYMEIGSLDNISDNVWLAPEEEIDILQNLRLNDYHFINEDDFEYTISNATVASRNYNIVTGLAANSSTSILIEHLPTGLHTTMTINTTPFMEGNYFFRNGSLGKYVQIAEGEAPDYDEHGAALELWDFDSGKHQEWILTREYQNYYSIVSAKSGMALTVQVEDINAGGYALVQEINYGLDRQLWKFEKTSDDRYIIRPRSSEEYATDWCMSVANATTNGTNAVQAEYNSADGNSADEWYILQPDFYVYVLYDNAYASRYSNRIDEIAEDMLNVHEVYWTNFKFFIAYSEATLFKSLADECADECANECTCECTDECTDECIDNCSAGCHNTNPADLCTHGSECSQTHHKNMNRILASVPSFSSPEGTSLQVATLAYIGHEVCAPSQGVCKKQNDYFGLAYSTTKKAIVMNIGLVGSAISAHVKATVIHEVGHWFGAPDHYDVPSTADINQQYDVDTFSCYCMYGEDKILAEIITGNHICKGCKDLISTYIDDHYR